MEQRVHKDFWWRMFVRCLGLFCGAMACLGFGMYAQSALAREAVAHAAYIGFVGCALGIPCYAHRRSKRCRCPGCGRWLASDPNHDREETVKFACGACQVEWDTQGIIDLW